MDRIQRILDHNGFDFSREGNVIIFRENESSIRRNISDLLRGTYKLPIIIEEGKDVTPKQDSIL